MYNVTIEISNEVAKLHDVELQRRIGYAAMALAMSAQQANEADDFDHPVTLTVRVRPFEWLTDDGFYTNIDDFAVGDYVVTGEMDFGPGSEGVGEVPVICYDALRGDYGFYC